MRHCVVMGKGVLHGPLVKCATRNLEVLIPSFARSKALQSPRLVAVTPGKRMALRAVAVILQKYC